MLLSLHQAFQHVRGTTHVHQLQFTRDQIVFARGYTVQLLDATPTADWFRMPPGGISHIGWQVGHLAMGQYRLLLGRVRGRVPSYQNLISELFLMQFSLAGSPCG
jgi:hypothetical protein